MCEDDACKTGGDSIVSTVTGIAGVDKNDEALVGVLTRFERVSNAAAATSALERAIVISMRTDAGLMTRLTPLVVTPSSAATLVMMASRTDDV